MKTNTRIQYKRLKTVWGYADVNNNLIELFGGMTGKQHLKILIHEKLHIMLPEWDEKSIRKAARDWADMLWKEGYRKIK